MRRSATLDGAKNTDGGKKIITDKKEQAAIAQWESSGDGWDCSNGKLQPQRRRVSALTSTEQITSSGTTVEKTFTMPEVPVGKAAKNPKGRTPHCTKAGGGTQYLREKRPTPAAMMTNIPKRKIAAVAQRHPQERDRGGESARASVWSQPVCCTSRSSNTPKKSGESATASSRPRYPPNQSSQKTATAPGRRHSLRPQVAANVSQPQCTLSASSKKGRPSRESCMVCVLFFVFILLFVLSAKAFHGDIETALLGKASDLP